MSFGPIGACEQPHASTTNRHFGPVSYTHLEFSDYLSYFRFFDIRSKFKITHKGKTFSPSVATFPPKTHRGRPSGTQTYNLPIPVGAVVWPVLPLSLINIFEAVRDADLETLIAPYLVVGLVTLSMLVLVRLVRMPRHRDTSGKIDFLPTLKRCV